MTDDRKRNIADREDLERLYHRPSMDSPTYATRTIGRMTAIIDQHMKNSHPVQGAAGLTLRDFRCTICDYAVQAELLRLYPAGGEARFFAGPIPSDSGDTGRNTAMGRVIESMWWSPMTPSPGIGAVTVQVSETEYRAYIGVYPSPCFETQEVSERRIASRGARLDEHVALVVLPLANTMGLKYGRH